MKNARSANLSTINGVKKTEGMITIKIKIFNIEKVMNVLVTDKENFQYDFLIGLDTIKEFQLIQDKNLEIRQKENGNIIKDKYVINKYSINFNEHIDVADFKISVNHLDYQKKTEIDRLMERYSAIFAKDRYDVGTVKDYEAHIDLLIDKYCSKRPYRCNMEERKEIETQIAKLLKNNLIEESYSPFAAPVTLAYKKDEDRKTRLCIDFRDLNKIVIPQSQPFPLIEDLMTKTRNCEYFSTLDINSAFWAIPLRIEDRKKTAFVTQEGHFQWTCLPFGLKTSPAIFQRILNIRCTNE